MLCYIWPTLEFNLKREDDTDLGEETWTPLTKQFKSRHEKKQYHEGHTKVSCN